MDKKKLKEKLHQCIDNLEDEKALQKLFEAAVEYEKAGKSDSVDEIKPERKRLEESIKTDEGKTIPDEEAMKRIAAWAFKLD